MNKRILLLSFYNDKALGLRCLAASLRQNGYEPYIVFFKRFNSVCPSTATPKELELLRQTIERVHPLFIGLSVMSSLYLETVFLVNHFTRERFSLPVVWGGVFPSLEPKLCAGFCNYVIRGEGEEAIVRLADALSQGDSPSGTSICSLLNNTSNNELCLLQTAYNNKELSVFSASGDSYERLLTTSYS